MRQEKKEKKLLKKLSDYPGLLKFWDQSKNKTNGNSILASSKEIFFWSCDKSPDHKWASTARKQILSVRGTKNGCIFCSNSNPSLSNSLFTINPKKARIADKSRNKNIWSIISLSGKKIHWKCQKYPDHMWSCSPHAKKSSNCKFCAGTNKPGTLDNNIALLNPSLSKQIYGLPSNRVFFGSTYGSKCFLKLQCTKSPDHIWKSTINSKTSSNQGCPFCNSFKTNLLNSVVLIGGDSLKNWDKEKNGDVDLYTKSITSDMESFYWKCNKSPDHSRKSSIRNVCFNFLDCSFCTNKGLSLTSSLAISNGFKHTLRYSHKNKIPLYEVVYGSGTSAWFTCEKSPDHELYGQVNHKMSGRAKCKFCYPNDRNVSISDALAIMADKSILQNFDKQKNKETLFDFRIGSKEEVFFKCPNNIKHKSFLKIISDVTNPNKNRVLCPTCSKTKDGVNKYIYSFLKKRHISVKKEAKIENTTSLKWGSKHLFVDVLAKVERKRIVIEFDGSYWHDKKFKTDQRKTDILVKLGYRVLRIRHTSSKKIHNCEVIMYRNNNLNYRSKKDLLRLCEELEEKINN